MPIFRQWELYSEGNQVGVFKGHNERQYGRSMIEDEFGVMRFL